MTYSLKAITRVLALVAIVVFAGVGPANALSLTTYETQIVTATNAYRAANGAKAVTPQACVDRWATSQAKWMAKTKKFQHRAGRLSKIMKACKLKGASENIGMGFSTGTALVDAWSKSSSHAANMRAKKMRYIGVGVYKGSNGKIYVSEVFGVHR